MYIQARQNGSPTIFQQPSETLVTTPTSTAKGDGGISKQSAALLVFICIMGAGMLLVLLVGCMGSKGRAERQKKAREAAEGQGQYIRGTPYSTGFPISRTSTITTLTNPWPPSKLTRNRTRGTNSYIPSPIAFTQTTSNRSDRVTQHTRTPIPRDRLAFHQAMASSEPTDAVPSRAPSYSQIQPPNILPPPSVARQDGRHPSVVFGDESRPGSPPPPNYHERHGDPLHSHHDEEPVPLRESRAPSYSLHI